MKIFLHRFGRGILFAGLALLATLGMKAEKGVILIDSDGNQRQMTLAEVKRVDIGTSGPSTMSTAHHLRTNMPISTVCLSAPRQHLSKIS